MSAVASDTENCCINVMFCHNCQMYLKTAVTGTCGHSRCTHCYEIKRICPCGNDLGAVDKDYLVTSLLEQRNVIENKLWTMLQAFLMPPDDDCPDKDYEEMMASVDQFTRPDYIDPLNVIFHNTFSHTFLKQYLCLLKAYPQDLLSVLYTVYKHRCQLWVAAGLLDCNICSKLFYRPVTTPCGHTFCRECLERVLDYGYRCPHCLLELNDFNIDAVHDNIFLSTAIQLSGALKSTPQPQPTNNSVYALECDAKMPSTPSCFLTSLSNQKYMFRQCSRSGNRMFAIITSNTQQSVGTLMLLRDVVKYRDGNLIVTAYGLQRIVIQNVTKTEGCLVIEFTPRADIMPEPSSSVFGYAKALSCLWYQSLHPDDQSEAVHLFGPMYSSMPEMDGPQWLWWMANVLPLSDVLRETYMNLNITQRCYVICCAVYAWHDFPGPKRFADIERGRLRLMMIMNKPNDYTMQLR